MRMRVFLFMLLVAILTLALVSGCKEGGPSTKIFVQNGTGQRIRIAVLPFDNVSKDQEAGRIITNTVITYLLSTGRFDVVEPGVVYAAMAESSIRSVNEGLTVDICRKLQKQLNADAFIVGMLEEFGEVRIGSDTYPSISFSARLVDSRTANILWAATISKTGAEGVKIFDIGRVASLGKLAKLAVRDMAESLSKSERQIVLAMRPGVSPEANVAQKPGTTAIAQVSATTEPAQTAKYQDESAAYGQPELSALLKDIGDAKLGPISYKKHFHDTIETAYKLATAGKTVEVRLVDYKKVDAARQFLKHYHPGEQETTFESLPAFTRESDFGYYHLDVAVGRFGIFLRGPKDQKADIDSLGQGIINSLK